MVITSLNAFQQPVAAEGFQDAGIGTPVAADRIAIVASLTPTGIDGAIATAFFRAIRATAVTVDEVMIVALLGTF